MFDQKSIEQLRYYVYMLIDPRNNMPFYIGKGTGNRVFNHLSFALDEKEVTNAKYETIREILAANQVVIHLVIRHGLSEEEALIVEASLIDAFNYCGFKLTNITNGHHATTHGLMTTDEVMRLYSAPPLESIDKDCIIININQRYQRGLDEEAIYKATKQTWTIRKDRLNKIKYVLSEFRGLIIQIYEVTEWYEQERDYLPTAKNYGKKRIGYGFNGIITNEEVRCKYINKSIAHKKKRGQAFPITYYDSFIKD